MKITEILTEGNIGPHEGNEIEMLLSGNKPAALLGANKLPQIKPYIKSGKLALAAKGKGFGGSSVIVVTPPSEQWRGQQILKQIEYQRSLPFGDTQTKRSHAKLGLLLGYSKEDIRHFLQTRFR